MADVEDADASTEGKKPRWKLKLTRDAVIFCVGVGGIIHETLFTQSDRPTLLILFAAMIGLPAFLRFDENRGGQ